MTEQMCEMLRLRDEETDSLLLTLVRLHGGGSAGIESVRARLDALTALQPGPTFGAVPR